MKKYFLDAGTTFSKILKVEDDRKEFSVIRTSELKNSDIEFEISTGHSTNFNRKTKYENEVVALSYGAKAMGIEDGVVLDLGSRDSKWVKFEKAKFKDMDWNTNCASATGATIEMLLKFYNITPKSLAMTTEKYPVTCGIFGLERIMEDVSRGISPEVAISKFIAGVAYNAFNFTKRPNKIYLSGGFCENKCFLDSLKSHTTTIPTGRFLLVEGLYSIYLGE